MKDCGSVAAPLTKLLQKDALHWNDIATEVFYNLKQMMVMLSVLALPNFNLLFMIQTYASGTGLRLF